MDILRNMRFFDAEGSPAAGSAAPAAAGQPAPDADPTKDKGDDKGAQPGPEGDKGNKVEFDLDSITKTEDGQLEFRAGESVYKGKDLDELLKNIQTGVTEKDSYIRQFKTKEVVKIPDSMRAKVDVEEAPEVALRNREEILSEVAPKIIKAHGVDSARFGWTNAQWNAFAEENNLRDWEISEERGKLKEARKAINEEADRVLGEETRKFVIANVIEEEHAQVLKAIAKSKLPPEVIKAKFDYEAILSKVTSDKENFNRYGNLKSGVIVNEVREALDELKEQINVPALRKKIEEDIARGSKAKDGLPSPSSGPEHKTKSKVFGSFDDALDDTIKEKGLLRT